MKFFILPLLFLSLVACTATSPTNANASAINAKLGIAYLERGDAVRAKSKLLLALEEDAKNYIIYDDFAYF